MSPRLAFPEQRFRSRQSLLTFYKFLLQSRSVWVGHMPTNKVDHLAALLVNTSSVFYTQGKPITKQLSTCIDPSLPLLSLQNSLGLEASGAAPAETGEAQGDKGKMSNKQTAFVASAAALGAIVLAIGAFFGSRYAMKKRASSGESLQGSRNSGSGSSFSSRRPYRNVPSYDDISAPMDRVSLPRDSQYYGSQSDYPATERDMMRDSFDSRAPPTSLPDAPSVYRRSMNSERTNPLARNGESSYYPTERSFARTGPSGSGSSVQSEILGSQRASMEIPIRDTWWKHASQWNDPTGGGDPMRGYSVMSDPVPESGRIVTLGSRPFSASTYSTLRTPASSGYGNPFGPTTPFGNNNKPSKISAPYLQDNSLML